MPWGLRRYQRTGDLHFVTFSCYRRQPKLGNPSTRTRFEWSLEETRARYLFHLLGYVVMPEHAHLLLTEPKEVQLATGDPSMQAVGIPAPGHTRILLAEPLLRLQRLHRSETIEKLRYMHRNPVNLRLVMSPEQWPWSSFRQYAKGIDGIVTVSVPRHTASPLDEIVTSPPWLR
jgi:putative transposase